MHDWSPVKRPAEIVEERLLRAILEGYFPGNANLPGERQFSRKIGVTRPTLREALQRLARDGWLEIRHGRPTRVRDFLTEGNLGILNVLARYPENVPKSMPRHTLEMRAVLAPVYVQLAVSRLPLEVASATSSALRSAQEELAFAIADWGFHFRMSVASGNPVYTLILNSISEMVIPALQRHYRSELARNHMLDFYTELNGAALRGDAPAAQAIAAKAMNRHLDLYTQSGEWV